MKKTTRILMACCVGLVGAMAFQQRGGEDVAPVPVAADEFEKPDGFGSSYSDVVIGTSGLPILVTPSGESNKIIIDQCTNTACTNRTTTEVVAPLLKDGGSASGPSYVLDSTGNQQWSIKSPVSADIDSAGRLYIAYSAGSTASTRAAVLLECDTLDCSSPSAAAIPYFIGNAQNISLDVGPNGPAVLSHGLGGKINFAPYSPHGIKGVALAAPCTLTEDSHTVATYYPSDKAGECFVPYACSEDPCSTGFSLREIADGDPVYGRALVNAAATGPIVTYMGDLPGSTSSGLIMNRCLDASCSTIAPPHAITTTVEPEHGPGIAMTLDSSDRPVMVYTAAIPSSTNGAQGPRLIACDDQNCQSYSDNPITTYEDGGKDTSDGNAPSIVLDQDEHPVVAYIDSLFHRSMARYQARVVRCEDRTCSEPQLPQPISKIITSAKRVDHWLDPAGNPGAMVVHSVYIQLASCDDPECFPVDPLAISGSTHNITNGPLTFTVKTHGVGKLEVYVGAATEPQFTAEIPEADPCSHDTYKCTYEWTVTLDSDTVDLPIGPTTIKIGERANDLPNGTLRYQPPISFPVTFTDDDVPVVDSTTSTTEPTTSTTEPTTSTTEPTTSTTEPTTSTTTIDPDSGIEVMDLTNAPVDPVGGQNINGARFAIQTDVDLSSHIDENNRLNLWFCVTEADCDKSDTSSTRPLGIAPISLTESSDGYIGTLLMDEVRPGTQEIYPAMPDGCVLHWMIAVDFDDPIGAGEGGVCFESHIGSTSTESTPSFADLLDPELVPVPRIITNEWIDGSQGILEFNDGERRTIYFDDPTEILPGPACSTHWSAWQITVDGDGVPEIIRAAQDGTGGTVELCITLP